MSDAAVPDELVGYRRAPAVRMSDAADDLVAADGDGALVSLVRYGDPAVAARAVHAMSAAAGPHVQSVLDVGTAPNGDIVVVSPHLPHALTALLARGPVLTPGQTVTVLVPIAEVILRIHRSGVAHGALSPAAVRFDSSGSPTVVGFDRAVLRRGPADLADARFDAAAAADRAALAELADRLLRRLGGGEIADRFARESQDLERIVDELFAWANPAPVRFDVPSSIDAPSATPSHRVTWSGGIGTPGRLIAPADAEPRLAAESHRDAPRSANGRRLAVAVPPADALRTAAQRLRAALRSVRRRVWVACGASVLLLVAAVVLLPGRGADAATRPAAVRTDAAQTASPHPPTASPSAAAVTAAPARTAAPAGDPGALGDPLRAFDGLRLARAACLVAHDSECLAAADSPGSPVAHQDADAITAGVLAVALPAEHPTLRAHSGSTATIAVGSVTVLLIRDHGRWRFRDVIGPPG